MPFHLSEVLIMMQSRALNGLGKMFRGHYLLIHRIIFPFLISFLSITVFLYLSYVIIEGYSIVRLVKTDRQIAIIKILED
jgi:hypothetical protein